MDRDRRRRTKANKEARKTHHVGFRSVFTLFGTGRNIPVSPRVCERVSPLWEAQRGRGRHRGAGSCVGGEGLHVTTSYLRRGIACFRNCVRLSVRR